MHTSFFKKQSIVATVLIILSVVFCGFQPVFASEEVCVQKYTESLQQRNALFEKELRKFSLQTTLNATEIVLYTKGALSVLYDDYNTICTSLGQRFAECGTEQVKPITNSDGSSPTFDALGSDGAQGLTSGIISANESTVNAQLKCQELASYMYEREEVVAREVLYGIVFAQRSYFLLQRFDTFLLKFQSLTKLFDESVSRLFKSVIEGIDLLTDRSA